MIIEFQEVEKSYGRVKALRGATMGVPEGAVMGLVGPNGAGKTTSMEIMSSLLSRDAGVVQVAGFDPERQPRALRATVGFMPDFFGVYEGLNAGEYLHFFASVQGVPPSSRSAVVADLLALISLEDKADADVNTLSRGMKQRLSLARALVHDPSILILDEPASGLDPRARVELRELISELARMGKTVLISSHILSELEGICSHMAVVDQGVVKAQGVIDEIRSALAGQRRVTLRAHPDHLLEAERTLRAEGVEELTVERDHLRFTADGTDDELAYQLARVISDGVPVWEWRVDRAGLEELFLRITEESA